MALKQDQAGRTVAASDTGPLTGSDFIPVIAVFIAARSTCVINCAMFAMCAYSKKVKWTLVKYEEKTLSHIHVSFCHICDPGPQNQP